MFFCFKCVVLNAHNIECNESISANFFTNNKTPVAAHDLFEIIGQRINCGCFFLQVDLIGETTKITTSEVSHSFFII